MMGSVNHEQEENGLRYHLLVCLFGAFFVLGITGNQVEAAERTVIVERGMTLYQIAKQNHVPLHFLAAYNRLSDPSLLRVGQRIRLPQEKAKQPRYFERGQLLGNFVLTAYTAGPESTGKDRGDQGYGITASDKQATEGLTIAVDPRVIPLGSRVYIEGLGYRVAQDVGSAIQGKRIDVYMEDVEAARAFGIQRNVRVELID
jgi:3D (Asp-Asp-Asp) domain-containing protein